MKNLFKLSLLALITAFLVGCGSSSGGGNEQGETEKGISAFMADFMFSDFDSGAVKPRVNGMTIYYNNLAETDVTAFRDALVANRGFATSDGNYYNPSNPKGFQVVEAYINIVSGGGNSSNFRLFLDKGNKSIAYSDFDLMFGDVNFDVSGVRIQYDYKPGVDMGDVFDDYYAKLIADGKLEATDCSISISPTEYSCYKNGQQWYAYNDIAYGASVSFNKWQ